MLACAAGYSWLFFSLSTNHTDQHTASICLMKNTIGLPCPSCGSTRAVEAIIHAQFMQALMLNPIGYVVAAFMLIIPVWITRDLLLKQESLLHSYLHAETQLRKPALYIPLLLAILVNWIWTIEKGL